MEDRVRLTARVVQVRQASCQLLGRDTGGCMSLRHGRPENSFAALVGFVDCGQGHGNWRLTAQQAARQFRRTSNEEVEASEEAYKSDDEACLRQAPRRITMQPSEGGSQGGGGEVEEWQTARVLRVSAFDGLQGFQVQIRTLARLL